MLVPQIFWMKADDIIFGAEIRKESNEKTISWIRSRSLLLELRTTEILTRSLQQPTKFCCYCCKKSRSFRKKKNCRNGSKRILHELVRGLEDLFNIESIDNEAIVFIYFDDASD